MTSPETPRPRLTCADVPVGQCCTSCHEDTEAGFDYMIELYDRTTREYRGSICCARYNNLPDGWKDERNVE